MTVIEARMPQEPSLTHRIVSLRPLLLLALFSCTAAAQEVVFQEDFESGNFSQWTWKNAAVEIVGAPNPVRSGSKAMHIPYGIPAGEPVHRDNTQYAQKDLSALGLDSFAVSGCFYLASTPSPSNQRKLFYLYSKGYSDPKWDVIVSVWGGIDGKPLYLTLSSNWWEPYSDLRWPKWDIASGKIAYDRWHCLETKVWLNTPGQRNGAVEIWLDGKQEYAVKDISIRADAAPLGNILLGAQIDRGEDSLERHEDRYWDDVKITSLSSNRPLPPTGVVVD